MPRLLHKDALDGPPVRARWTAILAAVLALTAWHTDWAAAWDGVRGLAPAQTERRDWNAAEIAAAPAVRDTAGLTGGIDEPASAATARLESGELVLELAWEAPLALTEVRVEAYTDAFGSGHRLAIAADATTAAGTNCLNARLATPGGTTAVQACSRSDRHPPLHPEPGKWDPDKLFVTQTAALDPADGTALVDHLGVGLNLGDSDETGVWGPNWWSPMMGGQYHDCDDPNLYAALEDLHLRPEYAIPTEHQGAPGTVVRGPVRVAPEPGALFVPACVPVNEDWSGDPRTGQAYATDPYLQAAPSAFAAWTRYNVAEPGPGPLRTIVAFDVRSCGTETASCTGDDITPPSRGNGGRAAESTAELLETGH